VRRLKQYKVFFEEEFARIVLKELVRFKLGVGKWLPLDVVRNCLHNTAEISRRRKQARKIDIVRA